MRRKILTVFLFLALALTGFISLVFAQGPTPPAPGGPTPPESSSITVNLPNPLSCNDIPCVGEAIIGGILKLITPIVIIMVLVGAFQILTAGGNPEKVTKGRKTILYAVVGYAIVLLAQGLVFIIKEILGE